jgi:hypothetical protein
MRLRLRLLFQTAMLGQPEISQLCYRPLPAERMIDQDIHRLDISVKVVSLVQPKETVGRLCDEFRQVPVPRHCTTAQIILTPVKDQPAPLFLFER